MQVSTSVGVDQCIRVSLRFMCSNLNCITPERKARRRIYGSNLNQLPATALPAIAMSPIRSSQRLRGTVRAGRCAPRARKEQNRPPNRGKNSAKAISASKSGLAMIELPGSHRERHAKKEWSAKARNHPRVASALPHSEDIAYKPPSGEIAMCSRVGRMGSTK
jgi:hypothetical protein